MRTLKIYSLHFHIYYSAQLTTVVTLNITCLELFYFHALEKEMATHSSVLAWRIPGTGEPGGLPSMGLHRVRHDWSDLATAAAELIYLIWILYLLTIFIQFLLPPTLPPLETNLWVGFFSSVFFFFFKILPMSEIMYLPLLNSLSRMPLRSIYVIATADFRKRDRWQKNRW